MARRLPIGAEYDAEGRSSFRVWAPGHTAVEVVLGGSSAVGDTAELGDGAHTYPLEQETSGYWSADVACQPGDLYRFRVDDGGLYPDPASRFQPLGPHGPSEIIDPFAFDWHDQTWPGLTLDNQIIYEMHVGTFTPKGSWEAATLELRGLGDLGITCIELMPLADFPGRFGWSYDGVDHFAPTRLYGHPNALRHFVDRAHGEGIAVILDVVYNHFGLEGNYLLRLSPAYQTDRYPNEWGSSVNLDGPGSGAVREFFLASAVHWLTEYHLDGFRLDAVQAVRDDSPEHFLAALSRTVRAAVGRPIVLIGEHEGQDRVGLTALEDGGWGLDAQWNDDFHHSARVALSGHQPAYFSGYCGKPQEFVSIAKHGYLYQGQFFHWQGKRRGTPTRGLSTAHFVHYLQDHDQVANYLGGRRPHLSSSPGRYRALTAVLLLLPQTPMLFQGQEFGSTRPFMYFADIGADLAVAVRQGREQFLRQFPALAANDLSAHMDDPGSEDTFLACKLETGERRRQGELYRLHKDLIELRRTDPTFSRQGRDGVDGAVLGEAAFAVRYFSDTGDDRLLLVNLGVDLTLRPAPEPLLAPPAGLRWQTLWHSEEFDYGGPGLSPPDETKEWFLQGESAVVMAPAPEERSSA